MQAAPLNETQSLDYIDYVREVTEEEKDDSNVLAIQMKSMDESN
jgi:hypothetical protein